MASGATHNKGTLLITIPTGIAALTFGAGWPGMLACGLGCLSGVILSPDLDIPHRTHSEYLVYKYLGKFLGGIWFAFWWPYAKFIPHRSPLSHMPILGTALRMVYLYILGSFVIFGVTGIAGNPQGMPPLATFNQPLFWWWLAGLAVSDGLHYIMDIVPFFKQRRKRKRSWGRILFRLLVDSIEANRKKKDERLLEENN